MKLVLENKDGKAVRTFVVDGDSAVVISRKDTRRVELHRDVASLEASKIKFDLLGDVTLAGIEKTPIEIGSGRLRLVKSVDAVVRNSEIEKENSKRWYVSLAAITFLQTLFIAFVLLRPHDTLKIDEEMKQQIVQIVKHIPVKQTQKAVPQNQANVETPTETKTVKTTTKTASIKRMGALSVFGSMKNGSQRGGVNLGAVNTTAGPGLGGTGGSGGVQTTLYGKGLVSAPLGAGSNMQGGGGYGTKGKGGGQAGYGTLSLVGSAGTASIPLGKEALIEGGLDRDLIADVINRNMGQIRFCYEQGLQGDPSLGGRVAVGFTIGGNGQVKIANVENTTLNSKLVEDCMVMRLKSWKFPLPSGGVDVKVSYPFMLKRTGQG